MNESEVQKFVARLLDFERKSIRIGDAFRVFLFKGTVLPEDFEENFNRVLEMSKTLNYELYDVLQYLSNKSRTRQGFSDLTPEVIKEKLSKGIEIVQEIQVKRIEQRERKIAHRKRSIAKFRSSHLDPYDSGIYNGHNQETGSSKGGSFVRFSESNTPNTPGREQLMYCESVDSSLDDDYDSAEMVGSKIVAMEKSVREMQSDLTRKRKRGGEQQSRLREITDLQAFIDNQLELKKQQPDRESRKGKKQWLEEPLIGDDVKRKESEDLKREVQRDFGLSTKSDHDSHVEDIQSGCCSKRKKAFIILAIIIFLCAVAAGALIII